MTKKLKILLVLVPVIVAFDQWTKAIVLKNFVWGESIDVIKGFFSFTYVRNTGAAFGIFAKSDPSFREPFFLVVPVLALVMIGVIFRKIPATHSLMAVALSLVMGGAVGNLIDRIRFGYVVDFLDFHWKFQYHFPAFNVADSAICVGVGLMLLDLFLNGEKQGEQGVA